VSKTASRTESEGKTEGKTGGPRSRPAGSRPAESHRTGAAARPATERQRRLRAWAPGLLIVAWTLAVHAAFLATSVLRGTPVSAFFFGDSLTFLEEARRLAAGLAPLPPGLPYHPPLTTWLLVPLWWLFGDLASVSVAAKLLMATLSGVSWALFYYLIKDRLPGKAIGSALVICLLGPLSFGELALCSAVSTEVPYRLLLLVLVALAWRWPFVAGLVHGLAALTRAEHLPLVVAAGAVALLVVSVHRRRTGTAPFPLGPWLLRVAAGLLVAVVPALVWAGSELATYNRQHAATLPEPLPVVVPISLYGPLNFALAQREDEIFFSRRTLPPPPDGGLAALDPTFPPHNEAILHGYRLGLAEIAAHPGRFLARTAAKVGHSLRALAFGWTFREWPRSASTWIRQPVDIAHGQGGLYTAFALLMVGLGAWALRRQKTFLAVGGVLLASRLAINAAFFPYLRGVLVVAPFLLTLFWAGCLATAGGLGLKATEPKGETRRRRLLAGALVLLAGYHFLTVGGSRRYRIAGERTEDGAIIDDRRVTIELVRP